MLPSFQFHSARPGIFADKLVLRKMSCILQNRLYVWCNKDRLTWNSYLEIVFSLPFGRPLFLQGFSASLENHATSGLGGILGRGMPEPAHPLSHMFLWLQAIWNLLYCLMVEQHLLRSGVEGVKTTCHYGVWNSSIFELEQELSQSDLDWLGVLDSCSVLELGF